MPDFHTPYLTSDGRSEMAFRWLIVLLTTFGAAFVYSPTSHAGNHLASSAALDTQTTGSPTQETITLEVGKPIERELAAGQSQTYVVSLNQNQYAKVVIEQKGIDLVARLSGSDGRLLSTADAEKTAQGSEIIAVIASASGSYRIEIAPGLPKANTGRYKIQLIEVHEAAADEKLLNEARNLLLEALKLNDAGKFDNAIEVANRALEIRQKSFGPDHVDVARTLIALGTIYLTKGDLARATGYFRRAEETISKISGLETLDYAEILHGLAGVAFNKGELEKAEQLNLRSLSIREKVAGHESVSVANSLFNLAMLYRVLNDFSKSEQHYLKALAVREKLLGPDHADVARLLNNLGLLYYGAGDYVGAEPILRRALAIRENLFGPHHRLVSSVLNNLGLLEWKRGNYEKAETYYQRAMVAAEKTQGPESNEVASSLHNLGVIYKEAGKDYAKSEESYQRALAIWVKLYGEDHLGPANALTSLALLYEAMGDFDRAEKFHLRAYATYEKVLGPNNEYTVLSLRGLADISAVKGDIDRSMEYRRRLGAIEEQILPLNITIGSERQKLAYFTQLEKPDKAISFHVGLAARDRTARDLAATKVLQRKGRILDALSENLLALRQRFNPTDQLLLDKLSDVTSRLAKLVLSAPKTSKEEHQNQVKALESERDNLEAEISRRSAGFYQPSRSITLAMLQDAIPSDAALIEFAIYRPVDLKAADDRNRYGEPRYVAYVIRRLGELKWVELGDAKDLDTRIDAFRQALRDPRRKDVRQLARSVDEKLMQPVRSLAGDAGHLLISPDGKLNLIPFEALIDERGRFLIERYAIAYLTSGRDLLRLQTPRDSKSPPMVFADPSFGNPALIASADSSPNSNWPSRTQFNYSQVFFGPLPGVGDEVRALRTLLPQGTFLTKEQATEATLKHVNAPSILHIATHGFFLESDAPATSSAAIKSPDGTRLGKWVARVENPLLRSGLALAGANQGRSGNDDGVLTALEATALDLWGTKLVVLSACDTGVGDVKNGDGVYGLRRALFLAGAESQLMSLWPVSDRSTRDLMVGYYQALVQNVGRGEALRRVRLQMLRNKPRSHPYYWASFILAGEWANMKGQR